MYFVKQCKVNAKVLALLLSLIAMDVVAKEDSIQFSGLASLGLEYDSRVTVDELDLSIDESDVALLSRLELAMTTPLSQNMNAKLGYSFRQRNYDKLSDLDSRSHQLTADVKADLDDYKTGVSALYIDDKLNGKNFLNYYRVSPYISRLLTKRWFVRGAYLYADKTLKSSPLRDASSHGAEFDAYYFQAGVNRYVNVGYRYRQEDATASYFDYNSHAFKVRYVHRVDVGEKKVKLQLAWRYEDRDYQGNSPVINRARRDRRHRLQASAEYAVWERGVVEIFAAAHRYKSNDPAVNYNKQLIGAKFSWHW